jgi:hypothetical protein
MRTQATKAASMRSAVDKPVFLPTYPRINGTASIGARPCGVRINGTAFTHKRYRPCHANPVVVRLSATPL